VLAEVVRQAAGRWGDATAFVATNGWSLSYRDLDRQSDEAAVGLARRGVGSGDVVALVLPSCPEFVVLYAAIAKLGAVTAGVNPRLASTERDAVLASADARLVVTDATLRPEGDNGAEQCVIESAAGAAAALRELRVIGQEPDPIPDDPDRPLAIVFMSGTTGQPKGAVFAGRQLRFITTIDTGDRWGGGGHALAGTSLAHLGPMTKLPGNLRRGTTSHLIARWRADDALALVAQHRMAGLGGIPTQVALMLRDPSFDRYDLRAVQAIVVGGGPASASLIREARRRFDAAVAVRYSCTEAGIGVGTAFDDPPGDAEESVGRAHHGVSLTIRDDEGVLGRDEVGEVCLRSPAVMTGYHRDAEATAAAFTPDGSVRTGDLGYVDDRGRLHLVGRTREMYVRGGYNVYPVEVENVLAESPLVADVVVVSRPDEVMGEIGVAFVVPVDGDRPPTLDEIRTFAESRLAHHKLPEDLRVVDDLPLTAMDKVDRSALESQL
jgi:acyl-CoA synthetase (AMP-forming)/AMP-acid ligase II